MFPSLQEYCKFKNTEDSAFPSVYIGLKDKLSGIRKVITDSTAHLIRLPAGLGLGLGLTAGAWWECSVSGEMEMFGTLIVMVSYKGVMFVTTH